MPWLTRMRSSGSLALSKLWCSAVAPGNSAVGALAGLEDLRLAVLCSMDIDIWLWMVSRGGGGGLLLGIPEAALSMEEVMEVGRLPMRLGIRSVELLRSSLLSWKPSSIQDGVGDVAPSGRTEAGGSKLSASPTIGMASAGLEAT